MSKLSTANTETILTEPFITEYIHVFFNAGTKKFPKNSLSMEVTNNKDMTDFKNLCEKIEKKTPFKFNKDNTKLYIKFGLPEDIKV